MRVLYVYADSPQEWNCSEWNAIIPTNAINRTENHSASAIYINEFVKNSPETQQLVANSDIIVVERNFFGDTLTVMQYWKVRNKPLVAIFDDAYDKMHPMNVSYNFWTNGDVPVKDAEGKVQIYKMLPPPLEQFSWGLQMTKGVQVPSVNLAKDWSKYNDTYYVHNFLDLEKYMNISPLIPKQKDEIVIGWCGSMSHFSSFTDSGVLEALRKIGKKYSHVKVLIGGDKRVFEKVEVENKIFQTYVPREQWTPLLKSIDIGLAPLSGEYDKRRSWIKALEYMALKIPWIASDYPTYDELHDYGKMTKNGYNNWVENLSEMIENYSKYQELAETKAYDFAVSQSSDNNIEKVTLRLYQMLIEKPYPMGNYKANLQF